MQNSLNHVITSIRQSKIVRLIGVGILVLFLQIPIFMIGSLVNERQGRQQSVIEEISSKWGQSQSINGPALIVPYTYQWNEMSATGQLINHTETRHAIFLPEKLQVAGKLDCAALFRGIYSVPVYKLNLTVSGVFPALNFKELGIDPASVIWERAQITLGISDAHAIQEQTEISWNSNRFPFLPGVEYCTGSNTGIHALVAINAEIQQYEFAFPLALNGSVGLFFVPFGQETIVDLNSNSGNPSFQGAWLPIDRSVSDNHFIAKWKIPFLGRNYPQAWTGQTDFRENIQNSRFGVNLIDLMNSYRMAERSVKYASLFILLTFTIVWLIELLAGVRVHPIQYLLLGASLCMFYLLELSLMEHLGFLLAYVLACMAVIGMTGSYSYSIFHRFKQTAIVAALIAGLYAYLYILLTNGDYALLIGSLGLFVILAVVMFITRRVDWYNSEIPARE
ncbi:MAG: cell envelope integrity protein CreD [Candidatus Omnitrophota bacterium]